MFVTAGRHSCIALFTYEHCINCKIKTVLNNKQWILFCGIRTNIEQNTQMDVWEKIKNPETERAIKRMKWTSETSEHWTFRPTESCFVSECWFTGSPNKANDISFDIRYFNAFWKDMQQKSLSKGSEPWHWMDRYTLFSVVYTLECNSNINWIWAR